MGLANTLTLIIITMAFTAYLIWKYIYGGGEVVYTGKYNTVAPVDAPVEDLPLPHEIHAQFDKISENKLVDTTGQHDPGVYVGGTSVTNRYGSGFTTPHDQTTKYIELPASVWSTLPDGLHWTLITWLEIRSIDTNPTSNQTRYFHGVNRIKGDSSSPPIEDAFFMTAYHDTTGYRVQPFSRFESNIFRDGERGTRFSLAVPFMLTVVRNGISNLTGPDSVSHSYTETGTDSFTKMVHIPQNMNGSCRNPIFGTGFGL
jgi:hypothetical protein